MKTYKEWTRSPGIYASYGDYTRGVEITQEYYRKQQQKELSQRIAKLVPKENK